MIMILVLTPRVCALPLVDTPIVFGGLGVHLVFLDRLS